MLRTQVLDWKVVEFNNWKAACLGFVAVRTFVTTPVFSYVFGVHDCVLSIFSWLSEAVGCLITVSSRLIHDPKSCCASSFNLGSRH